MDVFMPSLSLRPSSRFGRFVENAHFSVLKPYFRRVAEAGHHSSRSRRISKHRITLEMFGTMWKSLSAREKRNLLHSLFTFYQYLLRKRGRGMSSESRELQTTFVAFLDFDHVYNGARLSFLDQCMDSLAVEPQVILRMVPRRHLSCILFDSLRDKHFERSSTLASSAIRNYGSLYGYDKSYYLRLNLLLRDYIMGRGLNEEIREDIFNGNLRMQLICEVLIFLLEERNKDKEYLITLWKSVPFPFLTRDEIVAHMAHFVERITNFGDEMHSKCNEIWPVPDAIQPRSLKHLSRVQIRKTLHVDNRVGDEAINGLDYPPILKGYLRLDSF